MSDFLDALLPEEWQNEYWVCEPDHSIRPAVTRREAYTQMEEKVRVGDTHVGPYWISTVFLVLNHAFSGMSRPVVFETMVWRGDESEVLNQTKRYSTWDEAAAGHARTVRFVERYLRWMNPKPTR